MLSEQNRSVRRSGQGQPFNDSILSNRFEDPQPILIAKQTPVAAQEER